jgi:hypothetical protein
MQQEPKPGPGTQMTCSLAAPGRIRPEDVLRRKLMQKMNARRERRAAVTAPTVRRAFI